MKTTAVGERYIVIDDFLEPNALQQMREFVSAAQFRQVTSVVDPGVDGVAFRSAGKVLRHGAEIEAAAPCALTVSAILNEVACQSKIFGVAGSAWTLLTFSIWKYPNGSRLGWHNDAGRGRTGEYVLYLHDAWKPSWGSELVILDQAPSDQLGEMWNIDPLIAVENEVADSQTMLTAILPKPNRLVLLQAGTSHYVSSVHEARSERCSLSGFASKPLRAEVASRRLTQLGTVLGWGGTRPDMFEAHS